MRRRPTDDFAERHAASRRPMRALTWTVAATAFVAPLLLPAGERDALRGSHGTEARPVVSRFADLDHLLSLAERQAAALEGEAQELEGFYYTQMEPLVRTLTNRSGDRHLATRISVALVREGRRANVDPRLLLSVLLVENPWLDLEALSPVGAVGLMQVMPFHAGEWGCGGDDLTDLDINICHGTKILAQAIASSHGDLDAALLRYNGCVHGTNTPDCHLYPYWVLRYAGLAWLNGPQAPRVATALSSDGALQ